MTPVPGQANTYDMVRADQPTEAGDALNKANLLPDDVVAVLGITQENPQVKDALLAKPYVTGTYVGDGTDRREINIGFKPSYVILGGFSISRAPQSQKIEGYSIISGYGNYNGQNITHGTTANGFKVGLLDYGASTDQSNTCTNAPNEVYGYIAFR